MSSVEHIFLRVTNTKDSELEACEYLSLFARKCGFNEETIDEMRLAFIEAIINAKEHAPANIPDGDKKDIHITLTHVDDNIEIKLRDFGKGFDPTVVEKPDIRKKLKSSYKRGWGLMLMEKLMDGAEISSMPPSGTLIHLVKKRLAAPVTPTEAETLKEQKRFERLRYILGSFIDLSSFLCQSKNLQSGLRSMLRILLGTIGVSRGAIYTFDDDQKNLTCFVDIKLKANAKLPQITLSKETLEKISAKSDCIVTDIVKNDVNGFNDAFKEDGIEHVYTLKTDDQNHGLLILGTRFHKDEQEDFDSELLTIIARNISSAINTYKLMESLKLNNALLDKRLTELDKVREAAQIISSELEFANIPATVDGLFRSLFGVRKFSMVVYDPTEKRYNICNNDRGLPASIDLWSSPVSQYVINHKEAVLVKDLKQDARFQYPRCKNYASDSFAVIPVVVQGEVLAIVNLSDKGGDEAFTERDFELCKLVCGQLAIAIKNANLYKQGITDTLTGMYTNHYFRLRMSQEISRLRRINSQLAIILIGIDNFNELIEKCGEPTFKDVLVKKFGSSIKRSIRFNDLTCRFEGEKFAILLPDTTKEGALIVAEKLYNNLKHFLIKYDSVEYSTSVTLSVLPYDVKMSDAELIELAEKQLTKGQNEGGNKIISE